MKSLINKDVDKLAKIMPVLSKEEQRSYVGGGGVVRISVSRFYYGDYSTLGYFVATAYGSDGARIDSITGVFLEPSVDYERCTISGSNTAIQYGTYSVVPSTFKGRSGYFEVENVEGRTAIKIHPGRTWEHTQGCLIPGESGVMVNEKTHDHHVVGSAKMFNKLSGFINKYGKDGVTIDMSY